jgi:CheY-like chemotaxis protein
MRIVIVEDDPLQLDSIENALMSVFEDIAFTSFECASEYLDALASLERNPPDIFLFDIMLPWKLVGVPSPPPPDGWTVDRAGLELIKETRVRSALRDIPALAWTVLHPNQFAHTLPHRTVVVSKNDSLPHLVSAIRSLLLCVGKTPFMRNSGLQDLADTTDLKPGIFGVSVDLKKLWSVITKKRRK